MDERYTPNAEQAIRLAEAASKAQRHGFVGTEHLLLGLIREQEGTAAVVLREYQVKEENVLELMDRLIDTRHQNAGGTAQKQYLSRTRNRDWQNAGWNQSHDRLFHHGPE